MEKFQGWAMLSADCPAIDGLPDSFSYDVEGSFACDAREAARTLCRKELEARGLTAEIVPTNKHEVSAVSRDGTEVVYLVDVE